MQRRTALACLAVFAPGPAIAMYDLKPSGALALAPGSWKGSLTYRDWSNPDRLVTLACKMAAALTGPDELALYFVFDDGPGKIVYSYDRWSFDFHAQSMVWTAGAAKPSTSQYRLSSVRSSDDEARVSFERNLDARLEKYTLELSKRTWSLAKVEVSASGAETFRNKYAFGRGEA